MKKKVFKKSTSNSLSKEKDAVRLELSHNLTPKQINQNKATLLQFLWKSVIMECYHNTNQTTQTQLIEIHQIGISLKIGENGMWLSKYLTQEQLN